MQIRTKYIGMRITRYTKDFFRNYRLKKIGSVSSLIMDSFPYHYRLIVLKFKKLFKNTELKTIINYVRSRHESDDIENAGHATTIFVEIISDDGKFETFASNFKNKKGFKRRLKSLTDFELFILEIWANTFLLHPGSTDDIKEYLKIDYMFPG